MGRWVGCQPTPEPFAAAGPRTRHKRCSRLPGPHRPMGLGPTQRVLATRPQTPSIVSSPVTTQVCVARPLGATLRRTCPSLIHTHQSPSHSILVCVGYAASPVGQLNPCLPNTHHGGPSVLCGPRPAGPGRPRQAPAGPWDIVSPGRRPTRAPLTHHTLTSYGRPSAKPAHFSAPARRRGPIARPDLLSASKNQLTRRATFGRTGAPRGSGRWAAAGKGNASQPRMAHTSLAARGTILAQRPMHRLSPSKCQPRRD